MKSIFLLCLTATLATCMHVEVGAQNQRWFSRLTTQDWLSPVRKIELLKATKMDVEKILGKPEIFDFPSADFIEYYKTTSGRVTVSFSVGNCTTYGTKRVPKGIVEEISIAMSENIRFSDLGLPISKFKREPEGDTPLINYKNGAHGIEITVLNNRVTAIKFFPPTPTRYTCEP